MCQKVKTTVQEFGKTAIIAIVAIFIAGAANAQSNTKDEGVVIKGVKWATRNVGKPNTFAEKPESFGMFYQWNCKTAWNTTDKTVTGWNNDNANCKAWAWETSNNVCPTGWRIPTYNELASLGEGAFGELNGVEGIYFGSGNNKVFFPAAGNRSGFNGSLFNPEGHGFYWSSSLRSSENVSVLLFLNSLAGMDTYKSNYGMCVRCVAE